MMLVELCSGSLPSFPLEHHWPPTDKKGNPISGQVKDLLDTIRQHCLVEEEKKRSLVNLLQALGVDPLSVTQTPSQPTIAKEGKQEIETKPSPSNQDDVPKGKKNSFSFLFSFLQFLFGIIFIHQFGILFNFLGWCFLGFLLKAIEKYH